MSELINELVYEQVYDLVSKWVYACTSEWASELVYEWASEQQARNWFLMYTTTPIQYSINGNN